MFLMMTGEPTLSTAPEPLRHGAIDYLQKPVSKVDAPVDEPIVEVTVEPEDVPSTLPLVRRGPSLKDNPAECDAGSQLALLMPRVKDDDLPLVDFLRLFSQLSGCVWQRSARYGIGSIHRFLTDGYCCEQPQRKGGCRNGKGPASSHTTKFVFVSLKHQGFAPCWVGNLDRNETVITLPANLRPADNAKRSAVCQIHVRGPSPRIPRGASRSLQSVKST